MPLGPGKFRAGELLTEFHGHLCVVVISGPQGTDFDVAMVNPLILMSVPSLLRALADRLDREGGTH